MKRFLSQSGFMLNASWKSIIKGVLFDVSMMLPLLFMSIYTIPSECIFFTSCFRFLKKSGGSSGFSSRVTPSM